MTNTKSTLTKFADTLWTEGTHFSWRWMHFVWVCGLVFITFTMISKGEINVWSIMAIASAMLLMIVVLLAILLFPARTRQSKRNR